MPINLAGAGEQLSTSLPTIYGIFKLLYDEDGVMRSCATQLKLEPHTGVNKNVINYKRVVAYNVADGVDIQQAQNLADQLTQYTPSEVAVQVVIAGSTMRRVADPDLERRAAQMLKNALVLKEDQDGTNTFTSWVPTVGTTGNPISPGLCQAAMGRVRIGNNKANPEPFPGPYYGVLHPMHGMILEGRVVPYADTPTGTNAWDGGASHSGITVGPGRGGSQLAEDIIERGIGVMGQMAGAMIKLDANATLANTNDAWSAFFSQEGLIYVAEIEPRLDVDTSDASMRGAVELNLWNSYVWGLYRSSASGCSVLADATLPTS